MPGNILLADADQVVRESIAHVLTTEGYRVWLAASPNGAIQLLRFRPVDLIILDLDPPDQAGWPAFEELKRAAGREPILLITAQTNLLEPALRAGAVSLMEKPLDFPELLRQVKAWLAQESDAARANEAGAAAGR